LKHGNVKIYEIEYILYVFIIDTMIQSIVDLTRSAVKLIGVADVFGAIGIAETMPKGDVFTAGITLGVSSALKIAYRMSDNDNIKIGCAIIDISVTGMGNLMQLLVLVKALRRHFKVKETILVNAGEWMIAAIGTGGLMYFSWPVQYLRGLHHIMEPLTVTLKVNDVKLDDIASLLGGSKKSFIKW
jgi:hypothetical protein